MKQRLKRGPSLVILVTVLALVAGVAGTAVAGPDASTSVGKKKTKRIAKKISKKLDNKQDDRNFPVDSSKIGSEAVTSGKLAAGAVKAGKLGTINVRETSIQVINDSQNNTTVDCLTGEKVIGGGAKWDALNTERGLQQSYMDGNGWNAGGEAKTGGGTGTLTVYAYCLEA